MNLLSRPHFDLDSLFDHFFAPAALGANTASFFAPKVEIRDQGDCYTISAELPGVKKEDIRLTLAQGVLTLEAEVRQQNQEEKDGKIIRQERRFGKIARSFTVGNSVSEGDISASFKDGLLSVKAPKTPVAAEQSRTIQIKD